MGKLGHEFSSMDDLEEEVDLGDGVTKRHTYINDNLTKEQKEKVRELSREFVCCFAWDYTKILRLSRDLVEHWLPIKQGFRPYKQMARNFNAEIVGKVKAEVDKLLQAKFIRSCRYAEWVSNITCGKEKYMENQDMRRL
jgi:hypothetical protein